MNVYDTANNLAKEIRESEEFKKYKELKDKMNNNSEKKVKLDEFEKIRYEVQLAQLKGEHGSEDAINKMKEKYVELISDEEIKEYFDAELKFNVMLTDVNQIIGSAVEDLIK